MDPFTFRISLSPLNMTECNSNRNFEPFQPSMNLIGTLSKLFTHDALQISYLFLSPGITGMVWFSCNCPIMKIHGMEIVRRTMFFVGLLLPRKNVLWLKNTQKHGRRIKPIHVR